MLTKARAAMLGAVALVAALALAVFECLPSPAVPETIEAVEAVEPAETPTATDVLERVQAFYAEVTDLEAEFEQHYWNPNYAASARVSGSLSLAKPTKMVWDDRDAHGADYYASGGVLHVVEHDSREVSVRPVADAMLSEFGLVFMFGGDALRREFLVRHAKPKTFERYGDAEHHVLQLEPKRPDDRYKGIVLVVEADTGRVDDFVIYGVDDSTSHVRLRSIVTNVDIPDARFELEWPRGYVERLE